MGMPEWILAQAASACTYWAERGVCPALAAFVPYLAERMERVAESLRPRLHVADLYLAFACARGDRVALQVFERELLPVVRRVLVRMGIPTATGDDVFGALREQLFVPTGRAPLMTEYSGRGELVSWLRSVATNAARKSLRGRARLVDLDHANEIPIADPEIARLRNGDTTAFRDALSRAFAGLERDQRMLLRQHFLDGLTCEALGRLRGLHTSTAWRRLEVARKALVRAVRVQLAQTLGASDSAVTSIVRAAYSDASVASLLRVTPVPVAGA
jgi:RNA polymerase sigma-70 factor (ECF subfamily)